MSHPTDLREPSRATLVKHGAKRAGIIIATIAVLLFFGFAPSSLLGYRDLRQIISIIAFAVGVWKTMPTAAEMERYEQWKLRRRS